jgi:hypothetical protein
MRLLYALVRIPVKLTLDIAGRAVSAVGLGGDGGAEQQYAAPPAPAPARPAPPPAPAARPRRRSNGGAPPVAPEPAHVSEEPELVAEVADLGAEEGAGAEVHVDEPWEGYDRMSAAAIRGRLRMEGAAVAGTVRLYEAAHKGRSSVLEEAGRRTNARPSD